MSEARRRVAEHYAAEAEAFDRYMAPTLLQMSSALLPHLPLERARRVVDVGCGTGGLIPSLRQAVGANGATVFGVDLTEGMLAIARRNTGAPLAAMDAERLALRAGAVDVALFAFVLHRVGQPSEAVREAAAVLAPGGALGIVTWGASQAAEASRAWNDELARLDLPTEPPLIGNHAQLDSPERLEALLVGAGLVDARGWRRRAEWRADPEEWLAELLGHARMRRLAGLTAARRAAFERRVRARVAALGPEAFVQRPEAVYAVGWRSR